MALRADCEIAAGLQSQVDDLCNTAVFLPAMYVRAQLDLIGVLATLFDVEVELPELPGWRAVVLEEPPQLMEGENGQGVAQ